MFPASGCARAKGVDAEAELPHTYVKLPRKRFVCSASGCARAIGVDSFQLEAEQPHTALFGVNSLKKKRKKLVFFWCLACPSFVVEEKNQSTKFPKMPRAR